MQFVLILAAAVEKIDEKLAAAVAATLQQLPQCNGDVDVVWRYGLAVRVQLALTDAQAPEAELLGRIIDGAPADAADGVPFQQWMPPPLPSIISPSPSMWRRRDD